MSVSLDSPLLTNIETAKLLGVKPETLAVWRSEQRYDIPYIKVGRCVRYRLSDLEIWINSRLMQSTTPSIQGQVR
jgi:hypothetical protein